MIQEYLETFEVYQKQWCIQPTTLFRHLLVSPKVCMPSWKNVTYGVWKKQRFKALEELGCLKNDLFANNEVFSMILKHKKFDLSQKLRPTDAFLLRISVYLKSSYWASLLHCASNIETNFVHQIFWFFNPTLQVKIHCLR